MVYTVDRDWVWSLESRGECLAGLGLMGIGLGSRCLGITLVLMGSDEGQETALKSPNVVALHGDVGAIAKKASHKISAKLFDVDAAALYSLPRQGLKLLVRV